MNSQITPVNRQRVIAVGSWCTPAGLRADPVAVMDHTRPLLDWLDQARTTDDVYARLAALEQQQGNCRTDPSDALRGADMGIDVDWFLKCTLVLYAGATGQPAGAEAH